jgi:hypothetical protein
MPHIPPQHVCAPQSRTVPHDGFAAAIWAGAESEIFRMVFSLPHAGQETESRWAAGTIFSKSELHLRQANSYIGIVVSC